MQKQKLPFINMKCFG